MDTAHRPRYKRELKMGQVFQHRTMARKRTSDQRPESEKAVTVPSPYPRNVVLVGLMGAGKTSVGRRLATKLSLPFVDADSAIEEAAGCNVAEIFERFGEPGFRDGERKVITRLLEEGPTVIATGGGAFMQPDTREACMAQAVVVWLRASLDVLVGRTKGRTHRPLLNANDPRATLADLMAQRYPTYEQAHLVVDTKDEPTERTVRKVLDALAAHPHLAEIAA